MQFRMKQQQKIVLIVAAVIIAMIWLFSSSSLVKKEPEQVQKEDDFSVTFDLSKYKEIRLEDFLEPPHPVKFEGNPDRKYSQAKQDEAVYEIFPKKRGFFVDIGANDGQYYSNTLWLERKYKWTGLLIEANPGLCKHIDELHRNAWRLCACLSNTMKRASFIRAGGIGGVEDHLDKEHMQQFNFTRTVTVPCFSMEEILDKIKVRHIDFYSLDVEGAEMIILESMRSELSSGKMTVDVWAIEYRVWDGKKVVFEKSMHNLNALRKFFKDIGGYVEHSHLTNDENSGIGYALDVVFVRTRTWCKQKDVLPDGKKCQ